MFFLQSSRYTSRIRNVDSLMFVNRIREMASFELGKEIEKDGFPLVTSANPKVQGSIPGGDSKFFQCPTHVRQEEKHLSLFLY